MHFLFKVEGKIAQLLFDVTHDLALGGCGEGVATLGQNLHEIVGQVPAGHVETKDGMGKSITLIDGNGVCYTITAVQNDSCGTTRSVQRQHSLDSDIHGWGVESLKHDLKEVEREEFFSYVQCNVHASNSRFTLELVFVCLLRVSLVKTKQWPS